MTSDVLHYALVGSNVYSLRLPAEAIERLRETAVARRTQPTALVRQWVLERLAREPVALAVVSEPTAAYGSRSVPTPLRAYRDAIAEACRARGVARLLAFGSATGLRFDPATSDVDLAVTFLPMPPAVHASCFFGLIEDLERILGRAVDLVEETAIRNPYMRRSIARTGVVLYEPA